MNEASTLETQAPATVSQRRAIAKLPGVELVQAAELVLGHSDFVDVLQISRRGGLALIDHEGGLRVFKFIACQADWKKRWARRVGWNPARRAHRMSRALTRAGILVCPVEDFGGVRLPTSPRAVWTMSRYVENGRTLRQLKEELQPGRRSAAHPLVKELFGKALRLLRRIHDAGFEHRDYHAGNLLVTDLDLGAEDGSRARLHLVDLETVMQRTAGTSRRARDISRFLENFMEPQDFESRLAEIMNLYAPDNPTLGARILATSRMQKRLRNKVFSKLK
jgi:hypothetical protein